MTNAAFLSRGRLLYATLFCLLSATAQAWQSPDAVNEAARNFLERETLGLPGTVNIALGTFDPNNALPPCAALQPFLPPGTRAWGAINLGIRCDSPVTWTAYLQARVSVTANYLAAAQPLRASQLLGPNDITLRQGDLATLPDSTLTDPTQAIGYSTRYAITAGSPLRSDMLRIPPVIKQGQKVRVISGSSHFQVATEGRALNNAAAGEAARVQLPNGQTITGTARQDGTVDVPL